MIDANHPLKQAGFTDEAVTEFDVLYDSKPPMMTRDEFYLGTILHFSGKMMPTPGYLPDLSPREFIEFEETGK